MNDKQQKRLLRIMASALLCAAAIIVPFEVVKIIVFTISYLVSGYDVIVKAFKNIFKGKVMNEKFLMTVATLGAFIIGEYPEAAAVMIFYQIGELCESIATSKSKTSIAALMELKPDVTRVLTDGEEITVPTDEVEKGALILVKAGERIPLDGIIINGGCDVDTSSVTGESVPQRKNEGDEVYSGTVNLNGVISVKVTGVYSESTLAKILELTRSATERKAKTESFIRRFAKYYTPVVVYSALALAVIPSLIWGNPADWIYRGLNFLVVSCPCALVVSVPMSFFGGIGSAAKKGILIKGSNVIENLAHADTVVFDKTGTLTTAQFKVTEIFAENIDKDTLLKLTAAAEKGSNHPIAKGICSEVKEDNPFNAENITELAGMGITAQIENETYYFGNTSLMEKAGADYEKTDIGTVVHIAKGSEYLGYIAAEDAPKASAEGLVAELKASGIKKTVMLTGDNKVTAQKIAESLNIDSFKSELLPEDKLNAVEELIKSGDKVTFVGDGINDAPVIAGSSVGITMGALGSDAAIEAADAVIMDDNLSRLPTALKLSRKTLSIARQNIIFALSVKAIILILSALGIGNMWLAVFGDVGVTILAILNALRALK